MKVPALRLAPDFRLTCFIRHYMSGKEEQIVGEIFILPGLRCFFWFNQIYLDTPFQKASHNHMMSTLD